jgi:hypothetical protein
VRLTGEKQIPELAKVDMRKWAMGKKRREREKIWPAEK